MFDIKNQVFIIFFTMLLILIPVSLFSGDVIAYIGEAGGDVTVTKSDSSTSLNVSAGMLLNPGDIIKTGENSYTSIIFQDDGSRVKLDSNSRLVLNVKREKKRLRKRIFLGAGKLWARVVKRRGTDFQVKTPTSVASVKGTRFIIEEKEWGETWLWVTEDQVELSNEKGTIIINEGEKGKSTKDTLNKEKTKKGDLPIEPGKHSIIFHLEKEDNPSIQKELQIDFEK